MYNGGYINTSDSLSPVMHSPDGNALYYRKFINLISSESNEVCSREDKRTIAPEHVLKALEVLGFGEYIEDVYSAYEQHKVETIVIVYVLLLLVSCHQTFGIVNAGQN
ncbi:hypothetical protein POM88_036005 [Heracleum sosnowskyi]|uniref:Transcription factor CBF/NF-Y/archaeal histone domain-containing protein n=1 Tax=Heracleum sosnowskyi TaxID=360622 RepID=A0AAD8HP95_9APIA|nr:hypothetical protein POM88_036005 [Heracleum sosnowskyi]